MPDMTTLSRRVSDQSSALIRMPLAMLAFSCNFPPCRVACEAVAPCLHAEGRPCVGELAQFVVDAARHRTERIADQIGGLGEDGKLVAPFQERVGHQDYS
jgi:hypothetical protein